MLLIVGSHGTGYLKNYGLWTSQHFMENATVLLSTKLRNITSILQKGLTKVYYVTFTWTAAPLSHEGTSSVWQSPGFLLPPPYTPLGFLPTLQLHCCQWRNKPATGGQWRCRCEPPSCSRWWWPAGRWAGRLSFACWRGPLGSRASTPWWDGPCMWRCSPCSAESGVSGGKGDKKSHRRSHWAATLQLHWQRHVLHLMHRQPAGDLAFS